MGELSVNRWLRDSAMDHIDHALGRPVDPLAETYRNHFATGADSTEAKAFRSSPYWSEGEAGSWSGTMAFFYVTDEGRKALSEHLKQIGDPHRAFEISFMGHTVRRVGKSHGNARYAYWCDLSDALPDLSFRDFCKRSRTVLAGAAA